MPIHIIVIALAFELLNVTGLTALAQLRHIHRAAGVSPPQLPFWTAKELGKYGLSVELVVISSGPRGMQALLGGSLQSANMAAVSPIRSVLGSATARSRWC